MIAKKQVLAIPFLIGITLASLAVAGEKEFIWGITDAVHKIFPDQPYTGPKGNEWQLDAARNEYESCQLVLVPVAADLLMAEVFVQDFEGPEGAKIPSSAATVRLVRTARLDNREWPDPLPEAYPIDIPQGTVQAYWITVHVPEDAKAGMYRSTITVNTMSSKDGGVVEFPLKLRVRDFDLPTLSRYQMVGAATPEMRPYHIVACSSSGLNPRPRVYLDGQENLRVDFDEFDTKMEQALAEGVTNFSMGFSYVGAGEFAPWIFDWRVDVEGQNEPRRIYALPVDPNTPYVDTPDIQKSRKYFTQYLSQVYNHLEEKGWTKYWWVYGADEPHGKKWIKPLTRYFALIKKIAPKLRIMITKGPTEEYGPNLDVVCIMVNHLQAETIQYARKYKQELWTYSCGHLNNPSLIITESDLRVRLWHWLQEKWNVERVLLWHTCADSRSFFHAGVDRRGDGQIFWIRRGPDGKQQYFPSIRAEMLRDGIEDREYIFLLKKLTSQLATTAKTGALRQLLRQAKQLAFVPDELIETQFKMTSEVTKLLARRAKIAGMIEKLQAALRR